MFSSIKGNLKLTTPNISWITWLNMNPKYILNNKKEWSLDGFIFSFTKSADAVHSINNSNPSLSYLCWLKFLFVAEFLNSFAMQKVPGSILEPSRYFLSHCWKLCNMSQQLFFIHMLFFVYSYFKSYRNY